MKRPSLGVIVIGAGPYGLAAAAHLGWAGVPVRVFGVPMSFWQRHMPKGMWLRSPWGASHIGNPKQAPTLDEFERSRGEKIRQPIPLSDFVSYGQWFQERSGVRADPRQVRRVDRVGSHLRVTLEDGEQIAAERVVIAAGIADFAWRPPDFDGLPADFASHTSEHPDLARFAGKRVMVVGGGQSALESAVLLRELGADVEMHMRAPRFRWVGRATRDGVLGRLLFDRTDVGPALVSHVVARPFLLRRLRGRAQLYMTRRSLAAGAATWLRPRMADLVVRTGSRIVDAVPVDGAIQLRLDDGSRPTADHLLFATGYRVDLARHRFLPPELLADVACVSGYPVLNDSFESSVPGLHFLGATAVGSFGPLLRFVAGTGFAATVLARAISGEAPTSAWERARTAGRAQGSSQRPLVKD